MRISQKAFDMCVAEEVSSKAYYVKHYQRPEWPGLSSGVTVGIGYDLGQASRTKIQADWKGLVDPDMLMVMMSCSGITGGAAKQLLPSVRGKILIPWDAAISVFANRDVPQWTAAVLKAVPGAEKLTPSCLGVLFDLAYNRGCSFGLNGERYREMRAIKSHVARGNLAAVPGEIQSMKRLWPNTKGLLRRCDHRIALWREGMKETGVALAEAQVARTPPAPDPAVPLNEGPARTKPPATSTAQNATTGVIVAGAVAGAVQAQAAGSLSVGSAFLLAALGIGIAGGVWFFWYRNRNPVGALS